MLVMDPLCGKLACACVDGFAQRDYEPLAELIGRQTGRPVKLTHSFSMTAAVEADGGRPFDLIIGKQSVVRADASRADRDLRPLAMLRGLDGSTNVHGLFVVRAEDSANCLADLDGRSILFGPEAAFEKHHAAIHAMHRQGIEVQPPIEVAETCAMGALAVADGQADATVISSYAQPLLIGCQTIGADALRVVGRTASVPFITLFADRSLSPELIESVKQAAVMAGADQALARSLETQGGFVLFERHADQSCGDGLISAQRGWTGFMGSGRDGHCGQLPATLPGTARFLWQSDTTSRGLGGVAANARWVVVAGRSVDNRSDQVQAFDADTGQQLWIHQYEAPGELDYGSSPRATPLIHAGHVYTLGAFGHLRCLSLATGALRWERRLSQFGGKLPEWGHSAGPLITDEKLIVLPGGPDAAIVALSPETGKVIWQAPGGSATYASPIVAKLGGVRQVVAFSRYDKRTTMLGGYSLATGKRLWQLRDENENYYVVPTPTVWQEHLVVATEMNGLRMYRFDTQGRIIEQPVASSQEQFPTSASPVVVGNHLIGFDGWTTCHDLNDGLKLTYKSPTRSEDDHVSFLASSKRALGLGAGGKLTLYSLVNQQLAKVSELRPFDQNVGLEIWSYPAVVGNRLYLRAQDRVHCLLLGGGAGASAKALPSFSGEQDEPLP
jgi:outer membrane protein assembly factor BamB/ABC-type phosphate/phosphonate transport system substrate-binding protein